MTNFSQRLFIVILTLLSGTGSVLADVVKPALIEISVSTDEAVKIEIRASIEALLAGIGSEYKNTQDAPSAAAYDELRVMQPNDLLSAFQTFKHEMLRKISLVADGQAVELQVDKVIIPEPGYAKVPRISIIELSGNLSRNTKTLQWYYPASFGDNAVRVRQVDEKNEKWHWSEWQWLRSDEPSQLFSLQEVFTRQPIAEVVSTYVSIGFSHIVPKGLDHILFILGIYLLSIHLKPLLWQVTMFTLAHTLTLGLSMNGIISLPANIVEPLIALSIAYVGIENIFANRELHRSRLILVFGFGLLHGLGFAGVLSDFGMPDEDFVTALIGFNVGVELGQLAVITAAFFAVGLFFRTRPWYRKMIVVPGSALITIIGLVWTIDRLSF
jgi:hydrogenase/urease accessory protein HupE